MTHGVNNVDSRSALLFGNVSLYDSENIACGFIYDTSSNLSHKSGVERSTTANGNYALNISGLKANTIYYYRAYGVDAGQYKYGDIRSFTTKQNVSVTTGGATSVTYSSATLSGSVSGADQSLTCGIIYGTSSSLSSSSGTKKSTTSSGSYSISVTGLNANTTYYYRAYAIVDGEYVYGDVCSFTTRQNVSVTTGSAVSITSSGASLGGLISGSDYSLTCGIIYGTSSSLTSSSGTNKSTTSQGSYSLSVTGLKANTSYYYRAYALVDGVYKYGEVRSFTTNQNVSVTTGSATSVTYSSATLSGSVSGADQSLTCGIIYGTSSSLSSSSGTKKSTTSSGSYSISVTGLNANTTYYYRAYAIVDGEYVYGDVCSFTTRQNVSVTTGSAVSITSSGASLGGLISGSDYSLTCGIIYGTSSSLTSSSGTNKSTTSQGSYSLSVTGLKANTSYYYRAYALVDGVYKYGEVRSFTTDNGISFVNGFQAVDLGLPSGLLWASCNVGAESPEEYGDYFAWGETTTKSNYTGSNSVTYGLSISELESRGIIDAAGNLTAAYDAATANWGEDWRMPTLDEMKELINECKWESTSVNGVNGRLFTGPNGNSIFLPAAGCRYNESLNEAGYYGDYWSATPTSDSGYACHLYFFHNGSYGWRSRHRADGRAVRPVSEE